MPTDFRREPTTPMDSFIHADGDFGLRRIGKVIILHDPFFSRAAAFEESMVVSTVQARDVISDGF